jgi:alkylhydroperoxidase family enzyme
MQTHGAVASVVLGEALVEAVCTDWRTAPVDEKLRATLGFLEKLTLNPGDLTRADADAVREVGVSTDALIDAIHVCALFNMIVRIADALGFVVPPVEALRARAAWRLNNSYRLLDSPPPPPG